MASGDKDVVGRLFRAGAFVVSSTNDPFRAAFLGNGDKVNNALLHGFDVRAFGDGWSLLHWAAAGGHPKIISNLVARGLWASLPSRDLIEQTPLHVAVKFENPEAALCLLKLGASANATCSGPGKLDSFYEVLRW
jgi:ankyrin repeat protein